MTISTARSATLLFAGLFGFGGVVSAALASHTGDPRLMAAASAMFLAHAPALIALYAAWPAMRTASVAACLLILGTVLFTSDLVMRQTSGHGLFAMSAPTGGMLMMAGWLAIALGAFLRPRAT